jgi:uncharacterized protein (UPF0216 family)
MPEENKNMLSEEEVNYYYEKAELDLLRDALKRNYTERFNMMMNLIKMGRMLKNAKIIHRSTSH